MQPFFSLNNKDGLSSCYSQMLLGQCCPVGGCFWVTVFCVTAAILKHQPHNAALFLCLHWRKIWGEVSVCPCSDYFPPWPDWIDDRRWMDGWMGYAALALAFGCYMLPSASIEDVSQPAEIVRILAGFQHISAESNVQGASQNTAGGLFPLLQFLMSTCSDRMF